MELLYHEEKARSAYGCVVMPFFGFLTGAFTLATIGLFMKGTVDAIALAVLFPGPIATFLVFLCFNAIFSIIKDEVWRIGIRDDVLWWESPRFPRSKGMILLDDVDKVIILEGPSRLHVFTRDGGLLRIPCSAPKKVRLVLGNHYPNIAVEFIEAAD